MIFKKSCGSQGGIHQPPSFSSHHHPSSPSSFPLENLSAGSQNTLKTSLQVSSVLESTPTQSCHFLHCPASSVRVLGPGRACSSQTIRNRSVCLLGPALPPSPFYCPKTTSVTVGSIRFHTYCLDVMLMMMVMVMVTNTHHYVSVPVLSILHILSHFIFTTHEVDMMMMPILLYK